MGCNGQRRNLYKQPRFSHRLAEAIDVSPDGKRFLDLDDSVAEPPPNHLLLVQNSGEELKRRVPTRK